MSRAVDNALTGTLMEQYGFLPIGVRCTAAKAARAIVEEWLDRQAEWDRDHPLPVHCDACGTSIIGTADPDGDADLCDECSDGVA